MLTKFIKTTWTTVVPFVFCLYFFVSPTDGKANQCMNLVKINKNFYDESMGMVFHPTKNSWIVWERKGKISALNPANGLNSDILTLDENLDVRAEGGILSLAFHPNYPEQPYLFITRTIIAETNRHFVLERYTMVDYNIDLDSKKELLKAALIGLENVGGHITFDSKGYLFLSMGDGSNSGDVITQAITPHTLPGSLLRLDIDQSNKATPAIGNPFLELSDGAGEIYAYGFRNPTRFSIDHLTDQIWLSDVGIATAGEINLIRSKSFYGWSCRDGNINTSYANYCSENYQPFEQSPAFLYPSGGENYRIVGGHVYRGRSNPSWYGKYFFADYVSGNIWSADTNTKEGSLSNIQVAYNGPVLPTSFAVSKAQEIFLVDYQGRVFELEPRHCSEPASLLE